MDVIEIRSANGYARVASQGAQVLDCTFEGRPLLWLSPLATREAGQPVRGGVPLCFPWFGKAPAKSDGITLPNHGFARQRVWQLLDQQADSVCFQLCDDDASRLLWPYGFRVQLVIKITGELSFAISIENTGSQAFQCSYALHSYFAVADSLGCSVQGLAGRLRSEVGHVTVPQSGDLSFDRALDAIFERAPGPLLLQHPGGTVRIESDLPSAIAWNPGAAGEQVADIGPGWREFVCLERGRVGSQSFSLAPSAIHTASMTLVPAMVASNS